MLDSCDAGFYCAGSTKSGTLCCPEGSSLDACAKTYGVTGALTSVYPTSPSSTPTAAPTYPVSANTTSYAPTAYSTSCTSTISAGATYPAANATVGTTAAPTSTKVALSGGEVARPAGVVLALAAAAFAALL